MRSYIFVLLTFMASVSFSLDITPGGLYQATKEACVEVSRMDLQSSEIDKINAGYFPTRKYTEIMTFIRSDSFNKVLLGLDFSENIVASQILREPEFQRAINDCAGTNVRLTRVFVDSVSKSDRAGKTFAAFMLVVSVRGWAALFKSLPQKWHTYSGAIYKSLLGLMGTHLIRGDTDRAKTIVFQPDKQNEQDSIQNKRYQEMIISLRKQIYEEDEKIKACNRCADHKIYAANRDGLIELLQVVEKNKAN